MRENEFKGSWAAGIVTTMNDEGIANAEIIGRTASVLALTENLLHAIRFELDVPEWLMELMFKLAMDQDFDPENDVTIVDMKEFLRQVGKDDD